VSHQVSDLCPGEIGRRKDLKVAEEAVSERLFNPTGCSQKEIPPHKPKPADAQGEEEDLSCIEEETGGRYSSQGEIIDGVFDNPWDEELENIDDD
jgi:hypothetical protein